MSRRHECSNCRYFVGEVVDGQGRVLEFVGGCVNLGRTRIEADDFCNNYQRAAWFAREEKADDCCSD